MTAPRIIDPRTVPPLRQNNAPDDHDNHRVKYAWESWTALDTVYFPRDRSIEENVRMLVGQHWTFWSDRLQRFLSVDDWLTDDEKLWRQRPVLNRIVLWFMLTHARITENTAILGFLPGPDRIDKDLAETLDVLCKGVWREANMPDVLDRMATWLLPGGMAHLVSRVNPNAGPWRDWVGEAMLPLIGPNGMPIPGPDGRPLMQQVPDVPHDRQGRPLATLTPAGVMPILGPDGKPLQPYSEREGAIAVDVVSPLEVRGEWGPRPWHDKRYHLRVVFMSPEDVQDVFGVEVKADPSTDQTGQTGQLLDRVLFGSGWYGSSGGNRRSFQSQGGTIERDGMVRVLERWDRPNRAVAGMAEEKGYPGGRYLAVTHDKVLRDGPRPLAYMYCSNIRTFEYLRLPGRHAGATTQEFLNSPNRTHNRLAGAQFEHAALQANPKGLVAKGSGLDKQTISNKPAEYYEVIPQQGVRALEFVSPPAMSSDLYRSHETLLRYMTDVGTSQASPGQAPTRDASGELVKELRWDQDRPLGPVTRRMVEELGRLYEDFRVLLPIVFGSERLYAYTGDDNVYRTILVRPYLFQEGKADVVVDPESMFPEGRGEREARVWRLYEAGLLNGPPGSPQAMQKFHELSRFPHLSRAAKPGGVDRTTAEQNLGDVLQGQLAQKIPLYPWYDFAVHEATYREFMARPEFKKLDPMVQGQLAILWQTTRQAVLFQMIEQMQRAAILQPPQTEGSAPAGRAPNTRGGNGSREAAKSADRSRPGLPSGPRRASARQPINPLAR